MVNSQRKFMVNCQTFPYRSNEYIHSHPLILLKLFIFCLHYVTLYGSFFFFHFSVAHIVELSGSARSTRTAKVKLEMAPKWCPLSNWCSWTYGNWLQPSVCKKLLPCYLLKKYKITFFLIDKKQKTRYCLRLSPNTNHILQCIRQFSLI